MQNIRRLHQIKHQQYANKRHLLGAKEQDNHLWDTIYNQVKNSIPGTEQMKNKILNRRIIRYFGENSRISNDGYFYTRREPNYTNPFYIPKFDSILVYGIDFMPIKRIQNYFATFQIQIQKIDDSHCLIKFRNANEAYLSLQANCIEIDKRILRQNRGDLKKIKAKWFELNPYYELIFKRKLFARFSSNSDGSIQSNSLKNKQDYAAYVSAKVKFYEQFKRQTKNGDFRSKSRQNSSQRNSSQKRQRSRQSSKCNCHKKQQVSNKRLVELFQDQELNYGFQRRYYQRRRRSSSSSSISSIDRQRIDKVNQKFDKYISKSKKNTRQSIKIDLGEQNNEPHKTPYFEIKNDPELKYQFESTNWKDEKDFPLYLQRLKLNDSAQQYSEFNLTQQSKSKLSLFDDEQ